jgi:hypothetical protein
MKEGFLRVIYNQNPNSWIAISLRFLGIILTGLRQEISVYNVLITDQFQTTLAREVGVGWGRESVSRGDWE